MNNRVKCNTVVFFFFFVRQWWSLRGRRRRWVNVMIWTEEDVASLKFLCAYVQDRINREVVNVTTLAIPAELGGLLQTAAGNHTHTPAEKVVLFWKSCWVHLQNWLSPSVDGGLFITLTNIYRCEYLILFCVCFTGGEELHSDCLAVVQAPTVQVDPQLILPLDINNYLMTHYIQTMFRVQTRCCFGLHQSQNTNLC